jgi:AraC-like DNA-binding protein
MQKVRFSSEDLPATLDEQGKFEAWLEFYGNFYTMLEIERAEGRRFFVRFSAAQAGRIRLGRIEGSFSRVARTATAMETDQNNDFLIAMNIASSRLFYSQGGRTVSLEPGSAVLCTNAEAGVVKAEDVVSWMFVGLPEQTLRESHPGAVDLIGRPFDPANPSLRQLDRYVSMLLTADDIPDEPALTAHIESSLHDLVSLACDFEREMAPIGRMGAARGAQFRNVVSEIKASFTRPEFSPDDVCRKLNLSPRYLQALLTDSGENFTDRVMELRLQKSRRLLERAASRQQRISDIAYKSGFSDLSYFSRRFRARFGLSPGEWRASRLGIPSDAVV